LTRSDEKDEFGILFVCTANVCRSVIAERLTRHGIRARLGDEAARFAVASAGTAARHGAPMHGYTRQALAWLGADPEGFASRQLTAGDIDAADLILTAGAEHRNEVLAMCPRASRRSYLLREFGRLAAAIPAGSPSGAPAGAPAPGVAAPGVAERARDAVASAARLRGLVPYVEPAADEIADPAADPEAFLACARGIGAAIRPVLDALCGKTLCGKNLCGSPAIAGPHR
jgi:protein-tyrosine phosphatase